MQITAANRATIVFDWPKGAPNVIGTRSIAGAKIKLTTAARMWYANWMATPSVSQYPGAIEGQNSRRVTRKRL
jgi:hypothetical protein